MIRTDLPLNTWSSLASGRGVVIAARIAFIMRRTGEINEGSV